MTTDTPTPTPTPAERAPVPIVATVDREATRAWMATSPKASLWAEGVAGWDASRTDFVTDFEDLLYAAVDAGVCRFTAPVTDVYLERTADADGLDGGCVIFAGIGDMKLASLSIGSGELADGTGMDCVLDALDEVCAEVNRLYARFVATARHALTGTFTYLVIDALGDLRLTTHELAGRTRREVVDCEVYGGKSRAVEHVELDGGLHAFVNEDGLEEFGANPKATRLLNVLGESEWGYHGSIVLTGPDLASLTTDQINHISETYNLLFR